METSIPKTSTILKTLLRADLTTQWRNRRAVILTLIVPVIILVSWKGLIPKLGGPFVLSNSITIGLIATGLMGYSNSIARDRDKGIFQRLRVGPLPAWTIMGSRIAVQLGMIFLIATFVFIAGYEFDGVKLTAGGYALSYLTSLAGGLVYLSVGQAIVGGIRSPETVNATSRLIYFVFIMSGMFGELLLADAGKILHDIIVWSPYGTVKTIVAAGMEPAKWNNEASMALLVTLGYTIVFAFMGIKWFKWTSK
ncbi:ABC transporter permease [Mucilaginibacter flavidus]|uniref:ABC transporter permease n=1 Tax=Mucilaginibacter flavidus TaxID=2949309 RepID=UPI002092DC3E|nr:ABC transporter permease [Mucilaginibacter flavidus]MCO5950115.1 ABC transporter permease [Mucilaginibacter flavidus]